MKRKFRVFITVLIVILTNFLITSNIFPQTPELWGMTMEGGDYNAGTIFKTNANGDLHTVVHSFFNYEGGVPKFSKLLKASNGKLYGMTSSMGSNDIGVIFEYDIITNSYIKILDFDGANMGRRPMGSLMQATNGKLYGMTNYGGIIGLGVLFEYDITNNIFIKKVDFDGSNKGRCPTGNLIEANNGKLYGITSEGGTYNSGVLFEYDYATNIFIKKIDFDGTNKGKNPAGSLTQASNGKLYGVTSHGGINIGIGGFGCGVLYEYDPDSNIYVKNLDFNGVNYGNNPTNSLLQTSNGVLYGMTDRGGSVDYGVLFEYNIVSKSYTKKLDFNEAINGKLPYGNLMLASNGKLYGLNI